MDLTMSEAAKRMNVSKKTVERRVRTGELPAYQLGSGKNSPIRIREVDFLDYISKSQIVR